MKTIFILVGIILFITGASFFILYALIRRAWTGHKEILEDIDFEIKKTYIE